jgi:tetratricopeptide (TPR) repeat protein
MMPFHNRFRSSRLFVLAHASARAATALLLVLNVSALQAQRHAGGLESAAPYTAAATSAPVDVTHAIKPVYQLPFGANPYAPSEARAEFTGFLKQSDVPNAKWCGHCHEAIYAQWRESAHANSFRTPWYTKNVNLLIDQRGIERSRHCEGCHNPIALFSGMLTTGAPTDTASRPFDDEGVTCMSCHAIRSLQPTRGLGSYVIGVPAAMMDAKGEPMTSLPSDAEIYAHLDRHKAAVMRDVYTKPEFCGSCHKANLPHALNGYKWLRAFSTYDEWQQSAWAGMSPTPFFAKKDVSTCQTCHMPLVAASGVTANQGQIHSHRWLGANTAIPIEYGYDEQLKEVVEYLQRNALRVDVFAVEVQHNGKTAAVAAPIEKGGYKLYSGDVATVDVVVQNTGIGHSLVPEQRDMYESWLAVEVRDDSGRLVYESGGLDAQQRLKPDTHTFTNRILGLETSQDGGRLNHHEAWKVEARSYDSTVMPGRAVVERYRFRVPQDAGVLHVAASVKYRRFRREFLEWVFEDKPDHTNAFPTITMASDSAELPIDGKHAAAKTDSSAPERSTSAKPPLTIRWTAYGIGLMDRQQNRKALAAFAKATAIEPGRPWGYINEGVALYMDGDWEGSMVRLHKALSLDPDNPRARYYEGMCLRWQLHWKAAATRLEPVAAEYPGFRQVHDDLGYIYMVLHQHANARREFEAALASDPDDLIAHRWLGAAYAALGMKEQASAEAALTAEIKDDPQAMWRVQSYWRNHLDVAHDVVLDHVHGMQDPEQDKAVDKILNTQSPPSYIWIQQ